MYIFFFLFTCAGERHAADPAQGNAADGDLANAGVILHPIQDVPSNAREFPRVFAQTVSE